MIKTPETYINNINTIMRKKVIIYSRVSSHDQKVKGYSLPEQELTFRRYCEKNGWEIIAHYQDDHSAKDFNRPAFQKLLKDLRSKAVKADYFLCIKADRFSRDIRHALNEKQALLDAGLEIKFIEGDYDLSIPENLIPYMLNFTLAQVENERLSIRTKKGMRQAKRFGRWVGTPPKGYSAALVNDQKTIVPNNDASIIIEAFKEFSKGIFTTEQLRKIMVKKGLKVSENQFPNILRNPVYCGKIKIEAWRDEPEEIVVGLHEPLITEELFEKVQMILSRSSKPNKPHVNLNPDLPLRTFLRCLCGKNLTGSFSKGRSGYYSYYHCQNGCSFRVKAEEANRKFIDYLQKFTFPVEIVKLYEKVLEDAFKKHFRDDLVEVKANEKDFQKFKTLLEAAQDKFFSGEIDAETFKEAQNRYGHKLKDIQFILKDKDLERKELKKYLTGIHIISNLAEKYSKGSIEFKVKLLGSIFKERLEFFEDTYRTGKLNEVLELLVLNYNELHSIKSKKATKNGGFLQQAPPAGLEPATL